MLAAWGIDTDGKPVFVGLAPASSESTDAWDDFLADLGAGLVDGLRGSTLLTRRQGFGTGTPVAISLTVTDLDQPGSGSSGTIGVVAALGGASPSRRHSPLARTSPSSLATGLCSSLVVH